MARKTKKEVREEIAQKCINIVDTEHQMWEDALFYVTDKVAFRMRPLIKHLRKNYWGVFDQPIDPATGRDKLWMHLIMKLVEDYRKNINMGLKDINFRAANPNGYELTDLTRQYVRGYLERMFFGEVLDQSDMQLLIDGTVVWKTWESKENGKVKLNRKDVDLLNCYLDPTEDSIQSAYRFTERSVMLPNEVASMSGWMNTDVKGRENIEKLDGSTSAGNQTTGKFIDVWETWGKIPKWVITGDQKAEDANIEIDGHIVVSGLEAGEKTLHLVEENQKKDRYGNALKPYEECRITKLPGRWYGLGVAERALALQENLNITTNIRVNRNYISQLGLFKAKKGKGFTSQTLQRLMSNGVVLVEQMDDVEPMAVPSVGPDSYKDEEVLKSWAEAITSAYPIAAGGDVPASQTATTSAIQNSNAKTAYVIAREAKGFFLSRWMDRHALPIIAKTIKINDLVRLSSDDEDFSKIVDRVVAYQVGQQMDAIYATGVVPTLVQLQQAIDETREQLTRRKDLFLETTQELVADSVDTYIYFNNEVLDTTVAVQNLITMLSVAPEYRKSTVKMIYELMGFDQPREDIQAQMMEQNALQQGANNVQGIVENAQTPQLSTTV